MDATKITSVVKNPIERFEVSETLTQLLTYFQAKVSVVPEQQQLLTVFRYLYTLNQRPQPKHQP